MKGNFKFCSYSENSPTLDFEQTCINDKNAPKVYNPGKFNILEKNLYLINGNGYVCSRLKITIITKTYFFGGKESFKNEIRENIDRGDCLAMVISKKCQHYSMVCDKDRCQSIVEPKIEHVWLKDLTFHSYEQSRNKGLPI